MTAVYFSGFPVEPCDTDPRIPRNMTWYRLGSCHAAYVKPAYRRSDITVEETAGNCELMFDSGAFTAWSKGEEVQYDDLVAIYDDVVVRYEGKCKAIWLISLDKIPGERGRDGTAQEIREAMAISEANYLRLKHRFGARVLPVFHQDEPIDQLEHVVKSSMGYICVSPRNDVAEKKRVTWSKEAHRLIAGRVRTHGLAATGRRMLGTVPWSSVDSATWLFVGGNGGIFLLDGRVVAFSSKSPQLKDFDLHYRNQTGIHEAALRSYVQSFGFTVEELEHVSEARIIFNRIAMMHVGERMRPPTDSTLGIFDHA